MLSRATPESVGISSRQIQKYLELREKNRITTHDLLIARGDKIVFETYRAPFHKDYLHRMYSVTKSFIAIANGILEQEGKLYLDDKLVDFFPEESKNVTDPYMKAQTIRHMLIMSTAKRSFKWFGGGPDRVQTYFDNPNLESRPSGTIWEYDSSGSFVLGAIVERITGKLVLDYLREKFLDKIGFSKEAYLLKCPGGHSWGDSALICRPSDLLKVGRFLLDGGRYQGEQILNERFVREATSVQIDNNTNNTYGYVAQGYGYQIWHFFDDSFAFYGMGCQYMVAVPGTDILFVYNGDNQGFDRAGDIVIENFFDMISRTAGDPLPEDPAAQKELADYTATLKLSVAPGEKSSPIAATVSGNTYLMNENPMGITRMRVDFDGDRGTLSYTNVQGDKTLPFGLKENVFGDFPQEGYSDEIGDTFEPGHYYHCAASAGWTEPHKLHMKVQIIDKYFGQLDIILSFAGDSLGVYMCKTAEDFLDEYVGLAGGTKL